MVFVWMKIRKSFRPPKKAKILVYDGVVMSNLVPLFNGEPFEVFYSRNEILNLSPIILYKFLLYFIREKAIKYAYLMAYIDHVSPAIIITYIDNDRIFQQADSKNRDKGRKFIAIANGTRNFSARPIQLKMAGFNLKNIFHSNLFCHGQ